MHTAEKSKYTLRWQFIRYTWLHLMQFTTYHLRDGYNVQFLFRLFNRGVGFSGGCSVWCFHHTRWCKWVEVVQSAVDPTPLLLHSPDKVKPVQSTTWSKNHQEGGVRSSLTVLVIIDILAVWGVPACTCWSRDMAGVFDLWHLPCSRGGALNQWLLLCCGCGCGSSGRSVAFTIC